MVKVNASYKLTGWNTNQLKLRIPAILTQYGQVMDQELKASIEAQQYAWPRPTKRKNGTTVTSPRNIVDLGTLLRSQQRERPDATTLVFRWTAPHAEYVLRGGVTNRGTVMPSRDWIKPALEAEPLDRFFARLWAKYAGQGL